MAFRGLILEGVRPDAAQEADAEQMMIVVLGVELRAVDEPHRASETLVKGGRRLQLGRRFRECSNEGAAPLPELAQDFGDGATHMALGRGLETSGIRRRVDRALEPKIFEPLLPKLLHIGEMPGVLSHGPSPIQLAVSRFVFDGAKQFLKARQQSAKPLREIGEHP